VCAKQSLLTACKCHSQQPTRQFYRILTVVVNRFVSSIEQLLICVVEFFRHLIIKNSIEY